MSILKYRSNPIFPVFSACQQGFVVTGKPETDDFNRSLLAKNATGYWKMKSDRAKIGDAIFLILPSVDGVGGYPREIFGGVIREIECDEVNHGGRYKFSVHEFIFLECVDRAIKEYLLGNVPPMGNTLLGIWPGDDKSPFEEFEQAVQESILDSDESRNERLDKSEKYPATRTVLREEFVRNPDVVAAVLLRAKGCCESCKLPAPFMRRSTGTPYLEVHHEVFLSNGGEDTVANAVALCPNCHRKAHFG